MKKGVRFYKIYLSLIVILFLNFIICDAVYADNQTSQSICSLQVKAYYDYGKAFEVLNKLNAKRRERGLGGLKMDTQLLNAAMKRCVESAVIFSHSRPDDSEYYSINSDLIYGENIAAGRDTSDGTFEQWWNSVGHRKNMMNFAYKSVGIGCVQVNGIYYWSQEFGYKVVDESKGAENKNNIVNVSANVNNLDVYINTNKVRQTTGNTVKLEVFNRNKVFTYASIKLENTSLEWRSDNINVASVTRNGVIKCLCEGEATVRAVLKGTNKVVGVWSVVLTGSDEYEDEDLDENGVITPSKAKIKKVKILKKKKIKLYLKKIKKANGYEVMYSKNSSMKKVKIKKASKTAVIIKRISKAKVIYAKVRAYKILSNGKKVYGKWSKKTKVVL